MLETTSILKDASEELQNSQQFAKILKWIFTIGSYLNRGTRTSDTVGFSLESLPKIMETKTGHGNQTFIDYLVNKIEERNSENLHFEEELPHLEHASKVSIDLLNNHKKETETELQDLSKEITVYENSPPGTYSDTDQFLTVMKPFLIYAEKKLSNVNVALEEAITSFKSAVNYFGDDQKATPNSFFTNIVNFAHSFRRSHHLNMEKKRRLDTKLKRLEKAQKLQDSEYDSNLPLDHSLHTPDLLPIIH